MSLDLLGDGFDLHGGGQDLAFPHHENERAQAVAPGQRFARHWVHNGFVEVGGEKMSKSLGNFTNLLDLVDDGRPPRLPPARAAGALPLADGGHPRHGRRRPSAALGAPRRLRPAHRPASPAGRARRRRARPVPGARWTTTSTPRPPWRSLFDLVTGPTPRSTPATRSRRPTAWATVREIAPAVGIELAAAGGEVPAEVEQPGRRAGRGPGGQGLGRGRPAAGRDPGARLRGRGHARGTRVTPPELRCGPAAADRKRMLGGYRAQVGMAFEAIAEGLAPVRRQADGAPTCEG